MMTAQYLDHQTKKAYGKTPDELTYITNIVRFPKLAWILLLLKYSPTGELWVADVHAIADFYKSRSAPHRSINSARLRPYVATRKAKGLKDLVVYSCVPKNLRPLVDQVLDLLLTISPLFSASINRMNQLASEYEIYPFNYERKVNETKWRAARAREKSARARQTMKPSPPIG